jgi:hypothetical protein
MPNSKEEAATFYFSDNGDGGFYGCDWPKPPSTDLPQPALVAEALQVAVEEAGFQSPREALRRHLDPTSRETDRNFDRANKSGGVL